MTDSKTFDLPIKASLWFTTILINAILLQIIIGGVIKP